MQTIALSESAVAVLRFRVKGLRTPVTERRLPAFQELVNAGIMEPDGEASASPPRPWTGEKTCSARPKTGSSESGTSRPMQADFRRRPKPSCGGSPRRSASRSRRRTGPRSASWRRPGSWSSDIRSFDGEESSYRWTYWGWHGGVG